VWHNHYPPDRTLATVRWQALTLGHLLGVPVVPLVCVHGANVQGGGVRAKAWRSCPPPLLRCALGYDPVLSEADVELYAATARLRLQPAA
jgi:hypothetical protein